MAFLASQPLERRYISTVTVAEIRVGIERVTDVARRAKSNEWLTHEIRPLFGPRVVEVSEDVLFTWRVLVEAGRKAGHAFSQPDLFIAASVLRHGMTLVSRATSEYERARVPVVNPWT